MRVGDSLIHFTLFSAHHYRTHSLLPSLLSVTGDRSRSNSVRCRCRSGHTRTHIPPFFFHCFSTTPNLHKIRNIEGGDSLRRFFSATRKAADSGWAMGDSQQFQTTQRWWCWVNRRRQRTTREISMTAVVGDAVIGGW